MLLRITRCRERAAQPSSTECLTWQPKSASCRIFLTVLPNMNAQAYKAGTK
ncbi:MAG: hypothetical protein ACJAYF_003383 [Arenicella sp.]|jgi:hypothetical protein